MYSSKQSLVVWQQLIRHEMFIFVKFVSLGKCSLSLLGVKKIEDIHLANTYYCANGSLEREVPFLEFHHMYFRF